MITSVKMYTAWMHSLLSGEIIWGKTDLTVLCVAHNWDELAPVTYLYGASQAFNRHTVPASSQYVRHNALLDRVELCVSSIPVSYQGGASSPRVALLGYEYTSEINSIVVRPLFEFNLDFTASPIGSNEVGYITPTDGVLAHYTGDYYA